MIQKKLFVLQKMGIGQTGKNPMTQLVFSMKQYLNGQKNPPEFVMIRNLNSGAHVKVTSNIFDSYFLS